MILVLVILLGVLTVDAFSAWWLVQRIFAKVEPGKKYRVYRYLTFVLLFLVFAALSVYVIGSNITLQR
jgi:hypothetical protein